MNSIGAEQGNGVYDFALESGVGLAIVLATRQVTHSLINAVGVTVNPYALAVANIVSVFTDILFEGYNSSTNVSPTVKAILEGSVVTVLTALVYASGSGLGLYPVIVATVISLIVIGIAITVVRMGLNFVTQS
jgi:hypothetical protein